LVTAIGELNAKGVFNCYIKIVEERQPNLESMCTREAVKGEWSAITAKELAKETKGLKSYVDDKGVTHYEVPKTTTTQTVKAK